jgi:hypothetical protein
MNAFDRKIVNVARPSAAALFLCSAAAAVLLAGCAGGPVASVKVDPRSPIAGEVATLATRDRDYPSFNEIPAKPTDVRPARIYGERANDLLAARDQLDAATAPGTWTLNSTETFAARAQADAGPALGAPARDTEAFVAAARKRATPPPPPKR